MADGGHGQQRHGGTQLQVNLEHGKGAHLDADQHLALGKAMAEFASGLIEQPDS